MHEKEREREKKTTAYRFERGHFSDASTLPQTVRKFHRMDTVTQRASHTNGAANR